MCVDFVFGDLSGSFLGFFGGLEGCLGQRRGLRYKDVCKTRLSLCSWVGVAVWLC